MECSKGSSNFHLPILFLDLQRNVIPIFRDIIIGTIQLSINIAFRAKDNIIVLCF